MENIIDKLIEEVQQRSLQDIHIVAEQNRKSMELAKAAATLSTLLAGVE